MTKKDETPAPLDPQTPPAPTAEDQAGGELSVGDHVQIEATVAAISGGYLTLKVTRAHDAGDKDAAPRYDEGSTMTLHAKQVRKAKTAKH